MSNDRRSNHERVNVFEIDGRYLFKHYFEENAVFDLLKPYYNNHQYRFEVPRESFEEIRTFLADYGYELVLIEDITDLVVVVEQYTAHPENIFKGSVMQRQVDGYNCFLMADREAVEEAVDGGAVRVADTDLEQPF